MQKLTYFKDSNSFESVENAPDTVNCVVLAANVQKTFTKPTATSKILFSTNFVTGDSITFGAVTLTAVAANPTAIQFIPLSTLALTLAALIIQFQAIAQTYAGTFSVTDTNTSITFTNTSHANPVPALSNKASGVATPSQVIGARFVRLSAGQLFYYAVGINATIAAVDNAAGTGSVSVPATVQPFMNIENATTVSVISPTVGVVSAEFWG